tara:strand:- start:173 stop:514 length:342 start_codon:yes stop_codon:yes gene_type:complete
MTVQEVAQPRLCCSQNRVLLKSQRNEPNPMQLTANGAHMVVDFYPVKYSDGTISERLMYKTVTFCDKVQSKSYINTESFKKEVDNRVYGYNYEVTDMHTEPQLFNSALIQTRW